VDISIATMTTMVAITAIIVVDVDESGHFWQILFSE
jgi:hypothetical protein